MYGGCGSRDLGEGNPQLITEDFSGKEFNMITTYNKDAGEFGIQATEIMRGAFRSFIRKEHTTLIPPTALMS